jgi:hypothetical protein
MANGSSSGLAAGAMSSREASSRETTVPCTIDLEQSPDSLHAYVDLDGIVVGPGDEVIVHDAPTSIAFGEHSIIERTATVRRAGPLQRLWAHIEGYLELTELYEVSFSDGRAQ